MSPTQKKHTPDSGKLVGGIWVASKDTLTNAMESDRCCHMTSIVLAALPVLSILNTLHEAAGASATAHLSETAAGVAQFVLYGCGVGCVGCVLMSLFYSPKKQE